MRAAWRTVGPTMGLIVLATGLTAQTLPVPALPREPGSEPEPASGTEGPETGPPDRGDSLDASRHRPWEYALEAGVRWDGNIDFLVPNGPSGVAVIPRGSLARVFRGRRTDLRATAAGRWTGYPDEKEHNRYYADFSLAGNYRPSPHTSWRARASYEPGYSDSSRILLDQGVFLPLVKTRSFTGMLGLSRKMGRRTSLRMNGRFYRTEFGSDAPDLIDGQSVRGTVALDRQLGGRGTAAIEYAVEDVLSDQTGRSYLTHFGSLQWTRALSRRSALLLEAGASYTPDALQAGLEQPGGFFGGATLHRQLKRSSATLFLRREVTPVFGTGASRLELRAGLGATIPIGRHWELRMAASRVQPDTPPMAERVYPSGDDALAALGRRLGRRLELSAEVRYRRRGATQVFPMIEAFQAGLFLAMLAPSGRTTGQDPWR